ncbi:MAG: hypothetical protein Q4A32_07625 [Lachnospiraceae bacterium]|nr:hypothetical protein [Lachnospiraceae bacterium]
MTLKELYQDIGGDYDQAIRIMRAEKLIQKHICKLPKKGVVDALLAAGETMDPTQLFEASHAVKGIASNLGLASFAAAVSEISEEFRPGAGRTMSDAEVKDKIAGIGATYQKMVDCINRYEAG